MKEILKVVFVIIGTIIGAGFASRKRNLFIFWTISYIWNHRNLHIFYINGNRHIQSIQHNKRKKHSKL